MALAVSVFHRLFSTLVCLFFPAHSHIPQPWGSSPWQFEFGTSLNSALRKNGLGFKLDYGKTVSVLFCPGPLWQLSPRSWPTRLVCLGLPRFFGSFLSDRCTRARSHTHGGGERERERERAQQKGAWVYSSGHQRHQ